MDLFIRGGEEVRQRTRSGVDFKVLPCCRAKCKKITSNVFIFFIPYIFLSIVLMFPWAFLNTLFALVLFLCHNPVLVPLLEAVDEFVFRTEE